MIINFLQKNSSLLSNTSFTMRHLTTLILIGLSLNFLSGQKVGDLFDATYVHDIRLNLEQKNWKEQLDSLRLNGNSLLLGKVTIDGTTYENVGITYANSPTYMTAGKRNPWLIKLNFIDKKQNHQGYKEFAISQALRDPSMVREVLGYEIARKYMPAPYANFVNLTVNGESRGIHINVEAINEDFLQRNFQHTEGSFFRCVPDTRSEIKGDCERVFGALKLQKDVRCMMTNFEMMSKAGWDDLLELTRVLNEEPNKINKAMNLDRALWFIAFNNVVVNLNSYYGQYSGNYYLYRDKNNQFSFIPTELNLIFGSLKNTNGHSDLDLTGLTNLDPMLDVDNSNKPLVSQLLKNPDLKKIYYAHIRQILADWFENDAYRRRAEEFHKMITPYYEQDKTPPYPMADFKRSLTETVGSVTKIPGIVELMMARTKYLRKLNDMLVVPPVVSEVTFSNRKKFSNQSVTEFRMKAKVDKFPRRVRLFYRPLGSTEVYIEVSMLDDGKSHDVSAGDKIFGVVVNPNGKFTSMEYFIIAENAGAATFYPTNYVAEKATISIEELNK